MWRSLLVKNVALIAIVGLPTLAVAMAMTLWMVPLSGQSWATTAAASSTSELRLPCGSPEL